MSATTYDLNARARELAESWIEGDRTILVDIAQEESLHRAALLACSIYRELLAHPFGAMAFLAALDARARETQP